MNEAREKEIARAVREAVSRLNHILEVATMEGLTVEIEAHEYVSNVGGVRASHGVYFASIKHVRVIE